MMSLLYLKTKPTTRVMVVAQRRKGASLVQQRPLIMVPHPILMSHRVGVSKSGGPAYLTNHVQLG